MIKRIYSSLAVLVFLNEINYSNLISENLQTNLNGYLPFVQAIQNNELISLGLSQKSKLKSSVNPQTKYLQIKVGGKQSQGKNLVELDAEAEVESSASDVEDLLGGSSSSGSSSDSDSDSGTTSSSSSSILGGFIAGILLIGISIPLTWLNEGKEVKIYNLIQNARKSVKEDFNINEIKQENNLQLVYCNGKLKAPEEVKDPDFGYNLKNCVKLVRKVEMYQYEEKVTNHQDKHGKHHKKYDYNAKWIETVIDSQHFHNSSSHKNPNKMPCSSKQIHNDKVELGQYVLCEQQIEKITKMKECRLTEDQALEVEKTSQKLLEQYGYGKLQFKQTHFLCRLNSIKKDEHNSNADRIGDIKISWKYVPDGEHVTVIAQQIENHKGQTTFRQWNPQKIDVPYGEDNSCDVQESCPNSCFCCFCNCVEGVMGQVFQEIVDVFEEDNKKSDEIFNDMEKTNDSTTNVFRLVSWIICVLGFYLLFSPIITLISWIPLIGTLFSYILGFAAFVIALVAGSLTFLLVFAVAWVRYRPLLGLLILTLIFVVILGISLENKNAASTVSPSLASNSTTVANTTAS